MNGRATEAPRGLRSKDVNLARGWGRRVGGLAYQPPDPTGNPRDRRDGAEGGRDLQNQPLGVSVIAFAAPGRNGASIVPIMSGVGNARRDRRAIGEARNG